METGLNELKELFGIKDRDLRTYSPLTLAYIGDGVYELVIRTILVKKGNCPVNQLHKKASSLVKAGAQSKMMEVLEPVGIGNPQPLFAESRFRIRRLSIIGKAKNTLKMKINNASGTIMEALYFGDVQAFEQEARNICGDAEWECAQSGTQNRLLASFTYYPSVNEYMGRKTLQVTIQNYRFLKE